MKVSEKRLFRVRARIANRLLMEKDIHSPKDADLEELWAHLKINYRDGDEMVDGSGLIWDVWKKEAGFAMYCQETKEVIEIPQPKSLGG
jgi:hypothetical protein